MGLLDLLWHLTNLFVPAVGLGVLATGLAKLVWRRALRPVRFWNLAAWTVGVAATVTVAGLVITGQDGRMATYAAMVLASATVLWWRGLKGRSGA